MTQLEANLQQMEDEFDKEAKKGLFECFDNPEGDIRQTEEFWNDRDNDTFHHFEHIMNESVQWVEKHKYEIENHFTPVDWLKVYAESIQD